MLVDRSGQEKTLISRLEAYDAAKFSPDGRFLAFTQATGDNRDLWLYDIARATPTRLTFESDNFYPTWSPDGKRIAFGSRRTGPADVYSLAADGSGSVQSVYASPLLDFPGTFTPDGRTILIRQTNPTTGFDIVAVDVADSLHVARVVLQTRFNEMSPALSSDGKWMAYVSDETGRNEVYLRQYLTGEARWAVSVDGGSEPVWRRDGHELFFRNGNGMYAVSVEPGPGAAAPHIGKVSLLFSGNYVRNDRWAAYDVTPDGRQLVMVRNDVSTVQLQVATDWTALLSARATGAGGR